MPQPENLANDCSNTANMNQSMRLQHWIMVRLKENDSHFVRMGAQVSPAPD
jgi:hypothetical protein